MRILCLMLVISLAPGLLFAEPKLDTIQDCQKAFDDAVEPKDKEEALYHLIPLLMKEKRFKEVEEKSRLFLDKNNGFSKLRKAGVMRGLGECYEKQNQLDDALKTYVLTWTAYMGVIQESAPALESWMKILWERNKPGGDGAMSDRQGACEAGRQFIEQTERFEDKMRQVDHRLWLRVKDLVEKYEAELEK